ncbi:hypothetical protein HMPREF9544_04137 [Escherichia coli MS 153-1]|nr:hypothetical protein HMPREF9544_04137 [Escherichia coli MS 153-1]ESC89426.1 hypothetical protein HMPREF1593_05234 [Escherichia coli 907391]
MQCRYSSSQAYNTLETKLSGSPHVGIDEWRGIGATAAVC